MDGLGQSYDRASVEVRLVIKPGPRMERAAWMSLLGALA